MNKSLKYNKSKETLKVSTMGKVLRDIFRNVDSIVLIFQITLQFIFFTMLTKLPQSLDLIDLGPQWTRFTSRLPRNKETSYRRRKTVIFQLNDET